MIKPKTQDAIAKSLEKLKTEGNYRVFTDILRQRGDFPKAIWYGRYNIKQITNWCSNDYLGMGQNEYVISAMHTALDQTGAGSGGTRNIGGTSQYHVTLERELATLHNKEAALLFSSAYVANEWALVALSRIIPNICFISDNKNHNFGLQLSIPIFNGFAAKNNVSRSKVNFERSKNLLEQANLDMETTVYQAYNDTKGALKAYEAALKTLAARQEAYNYSKERYNVGLLNAFDFSQSQNRFEAAQSEVIRTKYDYIFKLKVLEFYFGIPITELN